jgi:hypothetical protein
MVWLSCPHSRNVGVSVSFVRNMWSGNLTRSGSKITWGKWQRHFEPRLTGDKLPTRRMPRGHTDLDSKNILREHLQNQTSWHIYNTSRISPILDESFTHTQLNLSIYLSIYLPIYLWCVCVCVCVHVCVCVCVCTESHHEQQFIVKMTNTQTICKYVSYVGWLVKSGNTHLLSLRACLYVSKQDSCSVSVSWNVYTHTIPERVCPSLPRRKSCQKWITVSRTRSWTRGDIKISVDEKEKKCWDVKSEG